MSGDDKRHPLPASEEARHEELLEHLHEGKSEGEDSAALVQPEGRPVAPDGKPYGEPGRT